MSFSPFIQSFIKNVPLTTNKTIALTDVGALFRGDITPVTITMNATNSQFYDGFYFSVLSNGVFTLDFTDFSNTNLIIKLTTGFSQQTKNILMIKVVNNGAGMTLYINDYSILNFRNLINVGVQSGNSTSVSGSKLVTLEVEYPSNGYTVTCTPDANSASEFVSAVIQSDTKTFIIYASSNFNVNWQTIPTTQPAS